MKNPLIITIVGAIIVGAVAFFGGIQYQKMQRGNFNQFANSQGRRFGPANQTGTNTSRPLAGQILSADPAGVTVKMMDGSSKIVLINDSTSVTEATSAGKQALQPGKQVVVFGTANSDGSVTASNIQLNPMFRMGGGPR